MNQFKRALVSVLLVLALLTASMPAFAAASSPTLKLLGSVNVYSATYTGKKLTPTVTVRDTDGKRVNAKYYTVKVVGKAKDAGEYTVKVTGKGNYTGTVEGTFVIKKAENPFVIKATKTTFRYSPTKVRKTRIRAKGVKGGATLGEWKSTTRRAYVENGKLYIKAGFKGHFNLSVRTTETKNYKSTKRVIRITVE